MFKTIAEAVAVILVLALLLAVYGITDPPAWIPPLHPGYWRGYYETKLFGRVWCLVNFYREGKHTKMLTLSGRPDLSHDIYVVEIDRSQSTFVHLTMQAEDYGGRIEAKQLYIGKRYIWGRLFAGRFKDFWERNEDDSIRGRIVSLPDKPRFEIEGLPPENVVPFFNELVFGRPVVSSLAEIDSLIEPVKTLPRQPGE